MRDALRLLWALMVIAMLTVLSAVLGCGPKPDDRKDGGAPLYGPPPSDAGKLDAASCIPAALYGPQPCSGNSDCVTRMGAGWYCETQDFGPNGCGGRSTWPVCVQGSAIDAGTPGNVDASCAPAVLYGPPPCTSDSDCTSWYGAGYRCDETAVLNTGCTFNAWPMCVKGDLDAGVPSPDASCEPLVLYGPPPCRSDRDCTTWYGAGWRCDPNSVVGGPCGTTGWPMCVQDLDAGVPKADAACDPVALYGPRPCQSDNDCTSPQKCDLNNTFSDGCGGQVRWPYCK
jgi:hypothetical protein